MPIRHALRNAPLACWWAVSFAVLLGGCHSANQSSLAAAKIDSRAAAAEAIHLYDTNGDGSLDSTEVAACPAMKRASDRYDQDHNDQISADEIAQHFQAIFGSGAGLLEVRCIVTRGGRPLSGAKVRFAPEKFLTLQEATATTDAEGIAFPSVPPDQLPERLRNAAMMQPGLYRVEIEHSSLPAESTKGLGFEIDPTNRAGTTARFDLR